MTNKEALKRYFMVFVPSMAGYLISVFGVAAIIDEGDPVTVLTYILALIPAGFVFIFMWASVRYVSELDEFLKMLQIKAVLWGLTALMAVSTAWGFLEMFTNVPKLPIFYAMPGFFLFYGLASVIINKRDNAGCATL